MRRPKERRALPLVLLRASAVCTDGVAATRAESREVVLSLSLSARLGIQIGKRGKNSLGRPWTSTLLWQLGCSSFWSFLFMWFRLLRLLLGHYLVL